MVFSLLKVWRLVGQWFWLGRIVDSRCKQSGNPKRGILHKIFQNTGHLTKDTDKGKNPFLGGTGTATGKIVFQKNIQTGKILYRKSIGKIWYRKKNGTSTRKIWYRK